MDRIAYRTIDRPDPALMQELSRFGVATIHEGLATSRVLLPPWFTLSVERTIVGPVQTALNQPYDNLTAHYVLDLAQEGDILLIGSRVQSLHEGALWGDLVSKSAKARGVAGVIVDGTIRDVAEIEELGLPVWYRGINPLRTGKSEMGSVNIPLLIGGVWIYPGDVIAADRDGIVVLRPDELEAAIAGASLREEKEATTAERLQRGESTYAVNRFDERVRQQGVREVDGPFPRERVQ